MGWRCLASPKPETYFQGSGVSRISKGLRYGFGVRLPETRHLAILKP